MDNEFRRVTDAFWASPQIGIDAVAEARLLGFTTIVNNRPDEEESGQPAGAAIEGAARGAGLDYAAIPVTHAGFTMAQVESMAEVLANADGPVLAFCRSGTRSTLLWALAQAKLGRDPARLADEAAAAGYDIGPVRAAIDDLAATAGT